MLFRLPNGLLKQETLNSIWHLQYIKRGFLQESLFFLIQKIARRNTIEQLLQKQAKRTT